MVANTPGGVVDLKTGRQRPHDRADRMTKITTATPGRRLPDLAAVPRRGHGRRRGIAKLPATDGRLRAHRLDAGARAVFLYGTGANGKSVFVNTLATILGDYATNAPMDTFMETRTDRHPTDMAGCAARASWPPSKPSRGDAGPNRRSRT